jgi:hypothetical protein
VPDRFLLHTGAACGWGCSSSNFLRFSCWCPNGTKKVGEAPWPKRKTCSRSLFLPMNLPCSQRQQPPLRISVGHACRYVWKGDE